MEQGKQGKVRPKRWGKRAGYKGYYCRHCMGFGLSERGNYCQISAEKRHDLTHL
jgi:hypothetical protein